MSGANSRTSGGTTAWKARSQPASAVPGGRATLTAVPESWREHVRERLGHTAPMRMTDGREPAYRDWSEGYDPASWLDRSILATREEIFPRHGLHPQP
jgi:acetoin utilization protein AcuC